ncbi:hypothetical protein HDU81_009404 [Chytriomyces hyalinus]|nr:hypothetical protein HDU81_009404 [Chytriomyces hyalinus]
MNPSNTGPTSLQTPAHESKIKSHYDVGRNAELAFEIEVPQRTPSLTTRHRDAPQTPINTLFMPSDPAQPHSLPYHPQGPASPSASSAAASMSTMDAYSLFQKVTTALNAAKKGKMPRNSEARRVFKSIRVLLNSIKDSSNMSQEGLRVVALLEQLTHMSDEFMKKRNPGSQIQNMVENLTSIVLINEDDPSGILREKSEDIREALATLVKLSADSLMAKEKSEKLMVFFHVLAQVFCSDAAAFFAAPESSRRTDDRFASHAAPTRAGNTRGSGDVFSRTTGQPGDRFANHAPPSRTSDTRGSGDVISRGTGQPDDRFASHAAQARAGDTRGSGDVFSRTTGQPDDRLASHAASTHIGEARPSGDVFSRAIGQLDDPLASHATPTRAGDTRVAGGDVMSRATDQPDVSHSASTHAGDSRLSGDVTSRATEQRPAVGGAAQGIDTGRSAPLFEGKPTDIGRNVSGGDRGNLPALPGKPESQHETRGQQQGPQMGTRDDFSVFPDLAKTIWNKIGPSLTNYVAPARTDIFDNVRNRAMARSAAGNEQQFGQPPVTDTSGEWEEALLESNGGQFRDLSDHAEATKDFIDLVHALSVDPRNHELRHEILKVIESVGVLGKVWMDLDRFTTDSDYDDEDADEETAADTAGKIRLTLLELGNFIKMFTNRPIEPLFKAIKAIHKVVSENFKEHEVFPDFLQLMRESLTTTPPNAKLLRSPRYLNRVRSTSAQTRAFFDRLVAMRCVDRDASTAEQSEPFYSKHRESTVGDYLATVLEDLHHIWSAIDQDVIVCKIRDTISQLLEAIFKSSDGSVGFNHILLNDLIESIVPEIMSDFKSINIPSLDYRDEEWQIHVEDMVVFIEAIIPKLCQIEFQNSIIFGLRKSIGTARAQKVELQFHRIFIDLREIPFWAKRTSGMSRTAEHGKLDMQILNDGITITVNVTVNLDPKDVSNPPLVPNRVDVDMGSVHLDIHGTKNDSLYSSVSDQIVGMIRKAMKKVVEAEIHLMIDRWNVQLNGLKALYA